MMQYTNCSSYMLSANLIKLEALKFTVQTIHEYKFYKCPPLLSTVVYNRLEMYRLVQNFRQILID